MSWFHQYHSQRPGGLRVGEACRILNILLHNVPHEGWPAELQGAAGFPMNDAGSGEHLGEFTSPSDDSFEKQMRPIVDAVESVSSANGFYRFREQKMDIGPTVSSFLWRM
jgi:hypothetical protein